MSDALKSIFQAGFLLVLYGFGALNATIFTHYCQGEFKEVSVFAAKKCCDESDNASCNPNDQLKKVPCCSFQIASVSHDSHEIQNTHFSNQWLVEDFVLPEFSISHVINEVKYPRIVLQDPGPPERDIDYFSSYQVYRI